MEHTLLCVLLLLNTHINSGHSEDDNGVVKAVLTIHPNSSQIFRGESVTLRCVIQGGGVTDWEYTWLTPSPDQCSQKEHECIISAAEFSHSGDYRCLGSHQQQDSKWSDAVRLTVTSLPKATLTVEANPVFPGETVTLTCSVESDSIWNYQWYKDRNDNVLPQSARHTITGDTFTINGATVNEGPYWCQGERESRPTSSSISDPVTITVNALPVASVSVSPQGLLYSGDAVTLQCVIQDYTDWTYYWSRDNQHLPSQTSKSIIFTIPITLMGQAGQYRCEGLRTDRPQRSQPSDDVTISVTALPTASVKIVTPQGLLYPGETVTLQCDISDYTDWTYRWFRYNKELPSQTRKTITISLPDQAGQYQCVGRRRGRPQKSNLSSALPIIITARPKATLTVKPNPVFPEETVTLTCSVGSDSSWIYQWYKDRTDNVVSQSGYSNIGVSHTISRGNVSDQGQYWCEGNRVSRPTSSQPSDPVTLTVKALPTASVKIVTPQGLLYPGETVTLQCDISDYTDWTYHWFRYNKELPSQTRKTITISLPDQAGQYQCVGRRRGRPQKSYHSSALPIIITALPKTTLTVKPNPVFPGETVTLMCSVGSDSSWIYQWVKDRNDNVVSQSGYSNIGVSHISRADVSDQGQYWCEGNRVSRPTSSQPSNAITLTVKALPKTTLTVKPNPAYTGEKVTLMCSVGSDSIWNYQWYKDWNYNVVSQSVRHTITGDTLTISRAAESDQGQYWCEGNRVSRPTSSQPSNAVTLTVKDYQPKTTLTSDKENIFTGDSVTLSCTVESSGWKFYWYRHRPDSTPVTTTSVYSYTLSWVSVSDGGQYWCRAGRGDPVYYTLYSDPVQINITERPVAVLTLQPNWTQIFIRETVTMRCDIQGGGDSDWNYRWYKNSQLLIPFNTKPEYRISPVYRTNSGSYTCEGVKGNKFSKISDAVQLTVSDQPKAVLSISHQWLNPGDSVSLSCGVKELSTGWRFSWYRTVPTLTEQSYSFELLPDRRNLTTEDSYTLIPAGPTPPGGYVCRAGRGDPVYDTLYSEPQFLWSGDLQPSVSLTVNPNRTQHFRSNTLSLSCELKRNSTGWRLMSYRERRVKSGCGPWGSITESTCTITSLNTWYSGVFWCESGSGEYSNAVNITVNVPPGSVVSISLPRLLCGLLVVSPFLLVSIVLTVKCCRARGLCSTVKSPQDQIPCDDVIEQTESSV